MKDSDVLREVRRDIESGTKFICWAIRASSGTKKQRDALIAWVETMLGHHTHYGSWLMEKLPEFTFTDDYEQITKKGRLAWLDWMIAYCEKEEAEASK